MNGLLSLMTDILVKQLAVGRAEMGITTRQHQFRLMNWMSGKR